MGWLAGWSHRKTVTITGQSGAGTDYQVNLSIGEASGGDFHLENHCTSFPNDITVTGSNGVTVLDYWIEDLTTDPIKMWVEVGDNLDSNVDVWVYYGKSGESSASNGDATFHFFDDFEDDDFSAKWNDMSVGVGIVSESGGNIRAYGNAGSGDNSGIFESKTAVVPAGYRTDIDVETISISLPNAVYIDIPSGSAVTDGIHTHFDVANGKILKKFISSIPTTVDTHALDAGTHSVGMLIETDGTCRFWLDDVEYDPGAGVDTSDMYLRQYCRRTSDTYWLTVKVHKYNDPEPAFDSADAEESAPVIGIGAQSQILNPWGFNKYGAVIG